MTQSLEQPRYPPIDDGDRVWTQKSKYYDIISSFFPERFDQIEELRMKARSDKNGLFLDGFCGWFCGEMAEFKKMMPVLKEYYEKASKLATISELKSLFEELDSKVDLECDHYDGFVILETMFFGNGGNTWWRLMNYTDAGGEFLNEDDGYIYRVTSRGFLFCNMFCVNG
jgi:hypothetical protein